MLGGSVCNPRLVLRGARLGAEVDGVGERGKRKEQKGEKKEVALPFHLARFCSARLARFTVGMLNRRTTSVTTNRACPGGNLCQKKPNIQTMPL
jgi:hypothetical protein